MASITDFFAAMVRSMTNEQVKLLQNVLYDEEIYRIEDRISKNNFVQPSEECLLTYKKNRIDGIKMYRDEANESLMFAKKVLEHLTK